MTGEAEPMATDMEAPVTGEMDQPASDGAAESMPGEDMAADTDVLAGDEFDGAGLAADSAAEMPAEPPADMSAEEGLSTPMEPDTMPAPEPVAEVTPAAGGLTSPGLVERLLANPLYLGAGAALLVLLGFFGLRRKRGVETEFQESILQAAHASSGDSDSAIVASEPESGETKTAHSSLLSEFAVSDMGSIRNDGEADPLAEADVYLAYGRYQQAEDLIRDALAKDDQREDLNLKLLEVYMASRNTSAFDEHAQAFLARLDGSSNPAWEKVAEMGRELNPGNPIYQEGGEPTLSRDDSAGQPAVPSDENDDETRAGQPGDEGLDFDMDLSYSPDEPDSAAFEPSDEAGEAIEPGMNFDMDSVEPDAVKQNDEGLEFDLEDFDIETAEDTAAGGGEEEVQGDGELADLDEVSTKLDLARAYIDMGDPDGARSILDEVMEEGSDNQKEEARGILEQIS
jgi:pilus assembly protein FimV